MTELWCNIEGERDIFSVSISPHLAIHHLKKQIYNKGSSRSFVGCDPKDLTLTKVDVNYNEETQKKIKAGQYRPTPNDQVLDEMDIISDLWVEPPDRHLHVFVGLPEGAGSPTLVSAGDDKPLDSGLVREYEDIFIKVKQWGAFESSDIERNGLRIYVDGTVPDFVAEFERELHRKAGLTPYARSVFEDVRNAQLLDVYFGPLNRTVEDGLPEESHRRVGRLEAIHLASIALNDWERYWDGELGNSIKEMLMNVVFLYHFALQPGITTTVRTYALTCLPRLITIYCRLYKQSVVAFQSYHEM